MKVRWTRSSVRLRITPTELDAIANGVAVEEALGLLPGSGGWSARITPAAAGTNEPTTLVMSGPALVLRLSHADRARLLAPDAEGVYFEQENGETALRYLIEKDFPCLHPRASEAQEPQTETFAPPPGFAERKDVAPAA